MLLSFVGTYHLVHAGYSNTKGYLEPYKNCKYHSQDYRGRRTRGAKEIYKHSHSSLRNVIGRCFIFLKAHFSILKCMASCLLDTQMLIVVACVTLHNFIRQEAQRGRCLSNMVRKISLSLTVTMRVMIMIKWKILCHLSFIMR